MIKRFMNIFLDAVASGAGFVFGGRAGFDLYDVVKRAIRQITQKVTNILKPSQGKLECLFCRQTLPSPLLKSERVIQCPRCKKENYVINDRLL